MKDVDTTVRLKAFEYLEEQCRLHADALPRDVLAAGFEFEGTRVPLVGPQGIFKPAILPEIPLSITTPPGPGGRDPQGRAGRNRRTDAHARSSGMPQSAFARYSALGAPETQARLSGGALRALPEGELGPRINHTNGEYSMGFAKFASLSAMKMIRSFIARLSRQDSGIASWP